MMISCPEEIAYRMGFINATKLREEAIKMATNGYGEYLLRLLEE
jgi:glucose-1-phosphate thymidylyltransferase